VKRPPWKTPRSKLPSARTTVSGWPSAPEGRVVAPNAPPLVASGIGAWSFFVHHKRYSARAYHSGGASTIDTISNISAAWGTGGVTG